MKKPKANLYMLIKIEVDDDNFPNNDVKEVGWNLNKFDALQKYVGEFCKRNNALWIDFYYNASDEKLPIYSNYGEYWIEGECSDEVKWEIRDDYHLHYEGY